MKMMHMLPEDMQLANERRFARAHIDGYITTFLQGEQDVCDAVAQGVQLLHDYAHQTYGYESKNLRMEMVRELDLEPIVWKIFIASAYAQIPEIFSSFTAKLAGLLGFDDKADSIRTVAEMVAVLCETNVYDLVQNERYGTWKIQSNLELPEKLYRFVEQSSYLPPHVCQPPKLTSNKQAVRTTCEPESMILNNNHHNGDICLDALNIMNSVELCLNTAFLCTVEEEPNKFLDDKDAVIQWNLFKRDSHEMYKLMVMQGNRFHLLHKVDKRGRSYAQGYHISTQGAPYKKATVDLFNKHEVTGVPAHLRIKP